MPNASTIAAARDVLAALFPKQALERERAVDLAITPDGRPRTDRATGLLAPEARPVTDADTVSVDGVDFDDLQAMIDAIPTNYAPTGATYITQTANSTLTAEQALSSLSTGLVKVTTGTGVLSTATANTDYLPVASPTATGTIQWGQSATDIIRLQGHMKHAGTVSSITVGAALGTGGSVGATIAGTGHAGELQLTAGTTSLATGTAATITFATARPDTNYVVQLTPRGLNAGINAVGAYATRNTTSDWLLRFAVAPTSGTVYSYTFFVFEWS